MVKYHMPLIHILNARINSINKKRALLTKFLFIFIFVGFLKFIPGHDVIIISGKYKVFTGATHFYPRRVPTSNKYA